MQDKASKVKQRRLAHKQKLSRRQRVSRKGCDKGESTRDGDGDGKRGTALRVSKDGALAKTKAAGARTVCASCHLLSASFRHLFFSSLHFFLCISSKIS